MRCKCKGKIRSSIKMTPACAACRLPALLCLLIVAILLCFFCQDSSALLIYDRQALLDIRASPKTLPNFGLGYQSSGLPPHLASIPAYLLRVPAVTLRRKRRRRRRKRAGVLVKLKILRRSTCWTDPRHPVRGSHLRCLRWIQPVVPSHPAAGCLQAPPSRCRVRNGGVDLRNLQPLRCGSTQAREGITFNLALLNARSLANKTFILNNFFTSRELDFVFLTETWIQVGKSIQFSELLPPNCLFFNSPRTTGRGGGVASIFKNSFQCRLSPLITFSSFELQTFIVNFTRPVLCTVVYRPPQFNKDFIKDFTDFVAGVKVNCDRFLIVGDFNIHVCCESRPLVKDFLNLIDSFNFTQSVCDATHKKGHTLDLILSFGLQINVGEISDTHISDHFAVLFNVTLPHSQVNRCATDRHVRTINPSTASEFSAAFNHSVLHTQGHYGTLTPDEFLDIFNCTCTDILDLVAPFRCKRSKPATEPWLNDTTRTLRCACRRTERKWKKDHLHVSLEILKNSLLQYHNAVKAAKSQFLSNLVSVNSHKPQFLLNT